jgi:Cys-rich protein (TIGR01571 family)
MASWNTGLLSIWDDFETMLNSTVLCGALVCMIPARNALEMNSGQAACGIRHGLLARIFRNCGCNDRDAAYSINLALCCMFPPILVFWRKQIRDTYSIEGSMIGDFMAYSMCFPCAAMQESRELKKRGISNMDVPIQISMDSR